MWILHNGMQRKTISFHVSANWVILLHKVSSWDILHMSSWDIFTCLYVKYGVSSSWRLMIIATQNQTDFSFLMST